MKNFLDQLLAGTSSRASFLRVSLLHMKRGLRLSINCAPSRGSANAWTLPYGVSFIEDTDVVGKRGRGSIKKRLDMMIRDTRVYGEVLAQQRRADLAGTVLGSSRDMEESLTGRKRLHGCLVTKLHGHSRGKWPFSSSSIVRFPGVPPGLRSG